jgi:hypothetical protein
MLWLLQNNYVDSPSGRMAFDGITSRMAFALRNSRRALHDFSFVAGEPLPELPVHQTDPHFFYGSTGLVQRLMSLPEWAPAVFLAPESLDQRAWLQNRRADMLNPTCEVMTLGELEANVPQSPFFVRPVVVAKAFSGQVARDGDLSGLYRARRGLLKELSPDLLVAVSPLQDIQAEYRLIVYRHRVVTGSRYVLNGQRSLSADLPEDVLAGANALAAHWMPSEFICMDVAVLPGGALRIIEFNSVHSCGLYDTPMARYIEAVEHAVWARG